MAVTKAILEKWMVAQKRHRLSDKQELWKGPASAVYRKYLFQAVQTGRAGNGQTAETDTEGNGSQETTAEAGKGQTAQGTGCHRE